jgi:hypothetical protein
MSLVDSAVLAELQSGAQPAVPRQATLATQERDNQINEALTAGKIAATSREVRRALGQGPEGTKAILDALTPGLVPTAEIGDGDDADDSADAAFEAAHAEFLAKAGIKKEG